MTRALHNDDGTDSQMLTSDQDKPTAAAQTVDVNNDVSGLEVCAITTAVHHVQLPPGPMSQDAQGKHTCGNSKGPNPLVVAQVSTFSPAVLEGRPRSRVLVGSAGSVDSHDIPPRWTGLAIRNTRAGRFAEMQGDADPRGRYYPSLEWRDLPAKLPFSWELPMLDLQARRWSDGFLSPRTPALRQEEFNLPIAPAGLRGKRTTVGSKRSEVHSCLDVGIFDGVGLCACSRGHFGFCGSYSGALGSSVGVLLGGFLFLWQ
jgi:hypothetical protein